jgi:hypothetical protein
MNAVVYFLCSVERQTGVAEQPCDLGDKAQI